MSHIIIPQRRIWTRQPTEPVDLDWSNPLAQGLAFANPLRPGVGMMDLVQRQFATTQPTSSRSNKYGIFPHFDSQAQFEKHPLGMGIGVYPPTTISWIQQITGNVNSWAMPLTMNPSAGFEYDWAIIQNNAYPAYRFSAGIRKEGGTNAMSWDDHGELNNDPVHYVLVMPSGFFGDQASWVLYKNGQKLAAKTPTTYATYLTGSFLLARSGDGFVGAIGNLLIWTRALDDSSVIDGICDNQWQIYKRRSRYVFVGAGSSSNTYTLSPGGSFTFSGSSSVIKTKQYSPSGSVTFSGTAAELKTKIQVPSGNITYSGTASLTLTNGSTEYTITPSGTITFSGTTDYVKERVIYPTGSITYNGSALELKIRSFVPTGNITFSGNNTEYRTKILAPTGLITFQGSAPITGPGGLTGATMTKLPMTGAGK